MTPEEKQNTIKQLHNTEARKFVKISYSADSNYFQKKAFLKRIDAHMRRTKRSDIDLLIVD